MIGESGRRELNESPALHGVVTLAAFAFFWEALGVSGLMPWMSAWASLGTGVLAAAAGVAAMALLIRSGRLPGTRRIRSVAPNIHKVFVLVNVAQVVLIVAAVVVLGRLGLGLQVPAAVCLVVGLHFFPLARSFGQPQYWWTGGLLVALALAGATTLADGGDAAGVRVLIGFGAALVMWATALHLARRG